MKEEFRLKSSTENSLGRDAAHIKSIRDKIQEYLCSNDISLKRFMDESTLPSSTINNLLYSNISDCKLSTAIALAKDLGISLDELTDAGTIEKTVLKNIISFRNLPQNTKYLCQWFIDYQVNLHKQAIHTSQKFITVMKPLCTNDGLAKVSNNFIQVDITGQAEDIKKKVYFGIKVGSEMLIPMYFPSTILLIANDRLPFPREHVVVIVGDTLFLARQRYECGHFNYYGIRDNKFKCNESGIDGVVGYVTGIVQDNDNQ